MTKSGTTAGSSKTSPQNVSKNITRTEKKLSVGDRLDILSKGLLLVGDVLTVQIVTMYDHGEQCTGIILRGVELKDGKLARTVNRVDSTPEAQP